MRHLSIPEAIYRDSLIGAAAVRVYGIIANLMSTGSEVSIISIAKMLGVSRQAVVRQVKILRTSGWLMVEPRQREDGGQAANYYEMRKPDRLIPEIVQPKLWAADKQITDADVFRGRVAPSDLLDPHRVAGYDYKFARLFESAAAETNRLHPPATYGVLGLKCGSLDNPSAILGDSGKSFEGGATVGKTETVGEKEETQPPFTPPIVPPYAPSLKPDFLKIEPNLTLADQLTELNLRAERDLAAITGLHVGLEQSGRERNVDAKAAKLVDDAKAARKKPLACAAKPAAALKAGTAPKDRLSSAAVALAEPWTLPDDWRALAEARLQAAVPGATHDWTTEAEDFRNFHLATGKRWASWKHVWQTWYSRTVKSIAEKAARAAANDKRYGGPAGAPKRQGFLRKIAWPDAVGMINDAIAAGTLQANLTPKEKDDYLISQGIDPISRR